jgi:hypothetical protein
MLPISRMINEQLIGNDIEGTDRGLVSRNINEFCFRN